MQNRPDLSDLYSLDRRFTGSTMVDGWNIWISSGNYIDFRGQRNGLHKHSYCEACLVLGGKGFFTYGNKQAALSRGDLFVADSGGSHEIISDISETLKIQFISFDFERTSGDSRGDGTSVQSQCISNFLEGHSIITGNCLRMAPWFEDLKSASGDSNKIKWFIRSNSLLYMILMDMLLMSTESLAAIDLPDSIDSRLKMAMGYISDNPFRKLSVEEIAFHASTTARTLRRLMKKQYNTTVIRKCLEIRIESASKHLLTAVDDSIAETAYLFGFENPSDFSRSFKKILNTTPLEFKTEKGTTFL